MGSDTIVSLVVQHFKDRKFQRGPYKSKDALEKAKIADANNTEKIIVDQSESAWLAYHIVKKAAGSSHGFEGRAELARSFNTLDTQSVEQRQLFARQLHMNLLASSPQPIVVGENDTSGRGLKRRRSARENHSPATPDTITSGHNNFLSYSTQQIPDNSNREDVSYVPITTTSTSGHNNLPSYSTQQASDNSTRQDDLLVNAKLKASKALLPGEFMDAVVRLKPLWQFETLVADISMVIPKGEMRDRFGCQMEIGIAKERVALYAKRLFGVELEAIDGVRYIRGPGGLKIEPNPSVQLRGCSRDTISVIFGDDIATAISASPLYLREELEARDQTDSVSMAITHKDSEVGRITLFLGEWRAYQIRDRLYK